MNLKGIVALLCGIFCVAEVTLCWDTEEIPRGEIIDAVHCKNDSSQSYALYLPSSYTPSSTWPVLYALDPGARGRVPVELYQDAAEKFQFVLVGSNTARNGPFVSIYTAVMSLWRDTTERFSLNEQRIYITGFSGGARAATAFSQITGAKVAGIIGCGAGLHSMLKPQEMNTAYYLGITGTEDFNYLEMLRLKERLAEAGIAHRIWVFAGGHAWPSAEICMQLWTWLEIMAMNLHLREEDSTLIDPVFQRETARANELESHGNLFQAVQAYEAMIPVFHNLRPLKDIQRKILQIEENPGFVKSRGLHQAQIRAEQDQVDALRRVLVALEQQPHISDFALSRLLEQAGFEAHIENVQSGFDEGSRALALRVLFGFEMDARGMGTKYQEQKQFALAARYLEVAIRANMDIPSRRMFLYFNLARVYAQNSLWDNALAALRKAAENGWRDAHSLEIEPAFNGLSEIPGFKALIDEMKRKKQNSKGDFPGEET